MPGYIHHIEWCVSDLEGLTNQLINQYGFAVISERDAVCPKNFRVKQRVLKSGLTVFILTKKLIRQTDEDNWKLSSEKCDNHSGLHCDQYPVLTCCQDEHEIDSVFNVALEVGDVDGATSNIMAANNFLPQTQATIIVPPTSLKVKTRSGEASIRLAVVHSPCGNVIHTLMDTREYRKLTGRPFLPGFVDIKTIEEADRSLSSLSTTHMDHVTYVCETNQSHRILKWYKTCFGMQPFQISNNSADLDALNNENVKEEAKEKAEFNLASIDIGDEVGMKMTVGEWITSWMCREEGVEFPPANEDNVLNFKLVMAEPLEKDSDSHVQQFLDSHGGPGLQHIGLTSNNVTKTVEWMTQNGADFRAPPPAYYQLEHKRKEIFSAQEDLDKFAQLGLLVDSEADIDAEEGVQDRFLIQIFTKPLFYPNQNTFFLEILERRGARGFGAGNITALAQSIILQQQLQQKNAVSVS